MPEVLCEQRDGGRRQHAAEHGDPARGDDPAHERLLERRPRAARVTADEDAAAAGPHRRSPAEPLDQVES